VVAVEGTWHDEVQLHRIPTLRDRIRLSGKRVLEIGPLDNPIVLRLEADVTYVDHADTETLRAKYRDDPAVNVRRIVPIDAVWARAPLPTALPDDSISCSRVTFSSTCPI